MRPSVRVGDKTIMNQEKRECAYPDCTREPFVTLQNLEGGEYCIFHCPTESKPIGLFNAGLAEYLRDIEKKDLEYDFRGFVFVGDVDLGKYYQIEISHNGKRVMKRISRLRPYWGAEFRKEALFIRTVFHGEVSFWGAIFHEEVYFTEAQFHRGVSFDKAEFHKGVSFAAADFRRGVSFNNAEFHKGAGFTAADFRRRADMFPECMKGEIYFADSNLEDISLTSLNLDKSAWIDFTGARLRNTIIRRQDMEGHILQERKRDFSAAREIYLLLKNNFHGLGRYDDESWAFTQEKEMERKTFLHFRKEHKERELGNRWTNRGARDCLYSIWLELECTARYLRERCSQGSWKRIDRLLSHLASLLADPITHLRDDVSAFVSFAESYRRERIGDVGHGEALYALCFYLKYPAKYLGSTALKYLYGWGERPFRIFLWCGLTILVSSLVYSLGEVVGRDGTLLQSYWGNLYFSGITFTSLGYGDYYPVGGTRFWAFLESFLGVFFIALFVFSFARRTGGR